MNFETDFDINDIIHIITRTISGGWTVLQSQLITRIHITVEEGKYFESYTISPVNKEGPNRVVSSKDIYIDLEDAKVEVARRNLESLHKLFCAVYSVLKSPNLPKDVVETLESAMSSVGDR